MTTRELRQLLEHVEDTREIVLRDPVRATGPRALDELRAVWSAARAEANFAYDSWRTQPGADSYAVYRAAEDRADAAQDALASAALAAETGRMSRSPRKGSTNVPLEPKT